MYHKINQLKSHKAPQKSYYLEGGFVVVPSVKSWGNVIETTDSR